MDNTAVKAPVLHGTTKYKKLENELESPNRKFLDSTVHQNDTMMHQQDGQLDMIEESIDTLKTVSTKINSELDEETV